MSTHRIKSIIVGVAVTALVLVVIYWAIFGWWQDMASRHWQWLTESLWGRAFWPGGWNVFGASASAYFFVGAILAVGAFFLWPHIKKEWVWDQQGRPHEVVTKSHSSIPAYVALALAVLIGVGSVPVWFVSRDDVSQAYAGDTRFIVENESNLTTNLRRLNGEYIEEGEFSQSWEPRAASATGARTVMSRTSSSDSGNTLLLDTLNYTYGDTPGWTAIRDGKRKQPLYGIAFWPGEGPVEICRFTGDYAINKALHGTMGNSLLDDIAAYDKSLFFDEEDMWGYCDGGQPVIVIPVKSWDGSGNRAVWYSAGVLVITGSSSGEAQIERVENIEPGQFPGPVYPASLAATQREETAMMAGFWNKHVRSFGYETTDVESQSGNASEFLLKSKVDGRLYWVTPLTARSSDSQLVTAYSVIRADVASNGTFNGQRIYVLANEDQRAVNLDDLEARTRQVISERDPGFFSAGGELIEFLPLDSNNWQVYAQINGRVVYRVNVPADSRIRPEVTNLDGLDENSPSVNDGDLPVQGESHCVADLSTLSDSQLIRCLSDISDEIDRRQEP